MPVSKRGRGKCTSDYSFVKNLCKELEVTAAERIDGEISEE